MGGGHTGLVGTDGTEVPYSSTLLSSPVVLTDGTKSAGGTACRGTLSLLSDSASVPQISTAWRMALST